jgi:MerR family regulatory protein
MHRKFQYSNIDVEKLKALSLAFPLIDIKKAAHELGVTVRTVRRWQAAGRMPKRTKHGHRQKYNKHDIAAMIAAKSSNAYPDQGDAK